jgi:hypothetical protein
MKIPFPALTDILLHHSEQQREEKSSHKVTLLNYKLLSLSRSFSTIFLTLQRVCMRRWNSIKFMFVPSNIDLNSGEWKNNMLSLLEPYLMHDFIMYMCHVDKHTRQRRVMDCGLGLGEGRWEEEEQEQEQHRQYHE